MRNLVESVFQHGSVVFVCGLELKPPLFTFPERSSDDPITYGFFSSLLLSVEAKVAVFSAIPAVGSEATLSVDMGV